MNEYTYLNLVENSENCELPVVKMLIYALADPFVFLIACYIFVFVIVDIASFTKNDEESQTSWRS